jgi:hypothetical protein
LLQNLPYCKKNIRGDKGGIKMVIQEVHFYLSEIEKIVNIIEDKNNLQLYAKALNELKSTLTHLQIDLYESNKLNKESEMKAR